MPKTHIALCVRALDKNMNFMNSDAMQYVSAILLSACACMCMCMMMYKAVRAGAVRMCRS